MAPIAAYVLAATAAARRFCVCLAPMRPARWTQVAHAYTYTQTDGQTGRQTHTLACDGLNNCCSGRTNNNNNENKSFLLCSDLVAIPIELVCSFILVTYILNRVHLFTIKSNVLYPYLYT